MGGGWARAGGKNNKTNPNHVEEEKNGPRPRPCARLGCGVAELQPHLLLQQTIGWRDAWGAGASGGAERLLTQIWGGGGVVSGQWEWPVTVARLFLALAHAVLFNYAVLGERKRSAGALGSCASRSLHSLHNFASALKHVTVVMLTQQGTRDHF